MSESWMFFDGTNYNANAIDDYFEDVFTSGLSTRAGVLRGVGSMLVVTGTSSPISVADGAAVVKGKYYKSTSTISISMPTPASLTRIDRIVLRIVYGSPASSGVKRLAGTEGGAAPALTQTDGTTWEISLAQVSVTTGGVCTVASERRAAKMQGCWSKGDIMHKSATLSGHYPIDPDMDAPDYDWHLCNGNTENGFVTPSMANMFIMNAGGTYAAGTSGGSNLGNLPNHAHSAGSLVAAVHLHAVAFSTGGAITGLGGMDGLAAGTIVHEHGVSNTTANNSSPSTVSGNTGNPTSLPTFSVLNPYFALSVFCYVGPNAV